MSRRLSLFTILLLCIMPASRAWGWGCTGHEVVALIALKAMRPEVATQVEALLAAQDHNYHGRFCSDLGLDPIAYYATWADDFRASTAGASTAPWHFWDVPLSRKTAADTEFCDQGCVTHALREQLAILSDNTQDATKRGEALKFVIHFVGDLHQPLHVEDNNDRGGNCVPTDFLNHHTKETNTTVGSYSPNLHGIWDTELPENIGGVTTRNQELVQDFAAKISSDQAAVIQQAASGPVDIMGWAMESHTLAQKDPYKRLPKKITVAKTSNPVTNCSDRNTSTKLAKKHESIQSSYITAVSPDVEMQLAKAGGRLAAVLNSAWASPN